MEVSWITAYSINTLSTNDALSYSGQTAKLQFVVSDYNDTVYDSALLIDSLTFGGQVDPPTGGFHADFNSGSISSDGFDAIGSKRPNCEQSRQRDLPRR